MNKDKVICKCGKLTKGDVLKAIHKGADSVKKVKKATNITMSCGDCKKKLKKFIKKQLQKKSVKSK